MLQNMLGGKNCCKCWNSLVVYKFNRVYTSKSVYRLWEYHYMCETTVVYGLLWSQKELCKNS